MPGHAGLTRVIGDAASQRFLRLLAPRREQLSEVHPQTRQGAQVVAPDLDHEFRALGTLCLRVGSEDVIPGLLERGVTHRMRGDAEIGVDIRTECGEQAAKVRRDVLALLGGRQDVERDGSHGA